MIGIAGVNVEASLLEDTQEDKSLPLRYAIPLEVDISPRTHGTWEPFPDGSRLWRLRIHSPGATDLNFGFTTFLLPDGVTLHVSSEEHDYFEGPYTHRDVKRHGELWLPVVPGDRAVIELFVPPQYKHEPELHLTHIGSGYRDLFGLQGGPNLSKAGDCNVDVICPQGDEWRDQISSVGVYSLAGRRVCSGQMIADVPGTFRNFFLTANHCRVQAGNARSVTVFWNFESMVCGNLGGGSLEQNQTGAQFLAARGDVDFTLLELDDEPEPPFRVFYSGWDVSGEAPQGSVAIHHPSTDEKSISINDDPLTTADSCIGSGGVDTHWLVDDWEEGTTEQGSSGSGIWDPATKKLVGFLSGGDASCTMQASDCYGKLSEAWDGPDSSSRLRDWLDPDETEAMTAEGAYSRNLLTLFSLDSSDHCDLSPATENGLWEPGETIDLPVTLQSFRAYTNIAGTLTSETPGITVINGTGTWADLDAGVPTRVDAPFTLRLDPSVACFSEVDFTLEVTAAEDGPFVLTSAVPVGSQLSPELPVEIPDSQGDEAGVATSTFVIHRSGLINDLDVFVDIEHTWVGDLQVSLTSPSGTTVVLLDRPGVPESPVGCNGNDMQITFNDDSTFNPEDHCAGSLPWFAGEARPAGPLTAFEGELSGGEWTLTVFDNSRGDEGTIRNWALLLDPPFQGLCQVCGAAAPQADLAVRKHRLAPPMPGSAGYQVTVSNAGPAAATGVILAESLEGALSGIEPPAGLRLAWPPVDV